MLICPLESTIIFSKCPVTTCMWYSGSGSCSHWAHSFPSRTNDTTTQSSEVNPETYTKIVQYVTVGKFLEAKSGRELTALKSSDFRPLAEFTDWCQARGVKGYKGIPYPEIVSHIKREL